MAGPNSIRMNRTNTQPVAVPRTRRVHGARVLTSLPAGKMVPIFAAHLLREDSLVASRIRISAEMMETVEVLMNAVHLTCQAWFVPDLALDRFQGSLDVFNRSYKKQPPLEGEAVIPFIETAAFGAHGANPVYKYLGLHGRPAQLVNTAYLEAYNQVFNFRARNRSPDIELRTRLQTDLAPAFWRHEMFSNIVPDYDQAAIDGEVPLTFGAQKLPVRGVGWSDTQDFQIAGTTIRKPGGTTEVTVTTAGQRWSDAADSSAGAGRTPVFKEDPDNIGFPDVWAELLANDVRISLANIDMARKTAAFARLRQKYNGLEDAYIIDMLMDGISIPEQAWRQPMLVGEASTIFGMSKRYASDAANLTESVVNGATFLDMMLTLPRVPTGGTIMIVAEVTPEQLFERQTDPWLHCTDVATLPEYTRDALDPEPVEIVKNERVDIDHDTPDDTFGYEPLNGRWNTTAPRIGGRFYRPAVDAGFDEDRQRLWAVETQNPVLSEDFYLCTTMHTKPFVVTNQDPFEIVSQGELRIEGNTVFGPPLIEATDDYNLVLDRVDTDKIVKG